MRTSWRRVGAALAVVGALLGGACGKSAEQKQAEETARAVEEAAKKMEEAGKKLEEAGKEMEKSGQAGAESMAKGLEAMAQGFGALAGAQNGKTVEPVSFKELQTAFGVLPGWEMGKPTGERMTAPVTFSSAKVTYRKGDAEIRATLTDSGFNQLLFIPFTMAMTAGYERETESGYEKSTSVAGFPGMEKWDSDGKAGEVSAFVNKRFILQLEGSNLEDTKVLHELAKATNLGKLPQ
jgi:hypothetical protein